MPTNHAAPEAELRGALEREGGRISRWSNGPGAVYPVHDHPYRKVLVVAGGSITFSVSGGRRVVAMRPGDRLDLPPGTPHSAVVGPDGVVCLEAHLEESA